MVSRSWISGSSRRGQRDHTRHQFVSIPVEGYAKADAEQAPVAAATNGGTTPPPLRRPPRLQEDIVSDRQAIVLSLESNVRAGLDGPVPGRPHLNDPKRLGADQHKRPRRRKSGGNSFVPVATRVPPEAVDGVQRLEQSRRIREPSMSTPGLAGFHHPILRLSRFPRRPTERNRHHIEGCHRESTITPDVSPRHEGTFATVRARRNRTDPVSQPRSGTREDDFTPRDATARVMLVGIGENQNWCEGAVSRGSWMPPVGGRWEDTVASPH